MNKPEATPAVDTSTPGGSYPYYSLKDALKIGEAVHALGGAHQPIPKSAMAAQLKVSEKSSSFSQQIAAARQYGMIDGRRDYTLPEDSKNYFIHTSEEGKRAALLKMLNKPPIFAKLIRQYQGQPLPDSEVLTNVVTLAGVKSKAWAARVAMLFIASAKFAGAVDDKNHLRYDSTLRAASVPKRTDEFKDLKADRHDSDSDTDVETPDGSHSVWADKDDTTGASARLEIRGTLTRKLWLKLKSYIDHVLTLDLPPSGKVGGKAKE